MGEKARISLLTATWHLPQPPPFQDPGLPTRGQRGLCGSHVAKKFFFFLLLRGHVPSCRGRDGENRGPNSLPCDPHPRPGALLHLALCARVCSWGVCFPQSPLCSYPSPMMPSAQIQKVGQDPQRGFHEGPSAPTPTPTPMGFYGKSSAVV